MASVLQFDENRPPWGALPAEQFLIRSWDWNSGERPNFQRLRLIQRFIALPELPPELDVLGSHRDRWTSSGLASTEFPLLSTVALSRTPTAREVEQILAPWRPESVRCLAVELWLATGMQESIWLRTHYGPGSDEKWAEFLAEEEENNPSYEESCAWRLLSDERVFNFGEYWELVFDILPEVLRGDFHMSRALDQAEIAEAHEDIKSLLRRKEDTVHFGGFVEHWQSKVVWQVQLLQARCYTSHLVVADKEAFESGKLRLLLLDPRRNIVRHGRVPPEEINMVDTYALMGRIIEEYWAHESSTYCDLGSKYTYEGEFGQTLYNLGDEKLQEEFLELVKGFPGVLSALGTE